MINSNNALLCCISESNAQIEKTLIMSKRSHTFKDFEIEDKIWPGYALARVSFYISKKLHYVRRYDLENSINATTVLEIRRSSKKNY